MPFPHESAICSYSRSKNTGESDNQIRLYLQSGGIHGLIHPPHQSTSLLFLLHLGLSDVPGPVWNGADSNKHSLPESYVTMLSFKEKYSRFYLHSPFCLDDVVCSGTRF